MSEDERYRSVQAQIAQLLDDATKEDTAGIVGLGSVWLAAEMYTRNEEAHARAAKRKERQHDGD